MQDGQKLWNDYVTLDAYFRTLDQNPELLAQANKSVYANKKQHTEEFNNAFPLVARRTSLAVGVVDELSKRFENQNNEFTKPKELYKWMLKGQQKNSFYPNIDYSEDTLSATKRGYNIEFVLHNWQEKDSIGFYVPIGLKWTPNNNTTARRLIKEIDTWHPGKHYDHETYAYSREIPSYITFQSDKNFKKQILEEKAVDPTNANVQAYQQAVADHELRHLIDHLLRTGYRKNATVEMQAELYWHPHPLLHYNLTDKLHRDVKKHQEHFETQRLLGEAIDKAKLKFQDKTIKLCIHKEKQELETLQEVTKTTIDICNNTPPHTQGPLSYLFSTNNIKDLPEQIQLVRPYIDKTPQQEPQETLQL